MTKLRARVQCGLVLVGVCLGAALTPSCSSAPTEICRCQSPRPIFRSSFTSAELELTGTPPSELQRLKPRQLLVESDAVTLRYELDGQAGSAKFSIVNKYGATAP
jgi:hypothetical protein